jgi:histidyl-tRNA synthetase
VLSELLENGADPEVANSYLDLFKGDICEDSCKQFCDAIDSEGLAEAVANLDEIISATRALTDDGVSVVFDPTLVRGMGYYTGPIFEVTVDNFNISIAGGGRYDEMIGKFSGEDVCACGFSIGFERIIAVLRDAGVTGEDEARDAVAFLVDVKADSARRLEVLQQAQALRDEGRDVAVLPMRKNIKRQVQTLEAQGFSQFEKVYAN